jgi:hypothetical protein
MAKRVFLTVFFSVLAILSFADSEHRLLGLVKDQITQEILQHVSVSIYKDTVLVGQNDTEINIDMNGTSGYWMVTVPREGGLYRFCFVKEGYEYLEKTVEIKPFKKSETMRFAFNVTMKRQAKDHKLNDVVIKATQIKFYHKGDTLVFNADAFNLAQGSMLDNLVKSIPGAELNDDGEIKVNGRKVDALLLNGEDFFKGKNQIMLENLPAYMVKDLKVYERRNQFDMLTGKAPQGEYVMDVNLKKQYSIGAIGNVEAGMGSENRYLARLFALRFTDASRVSAYLNLNNLNDKRKPGETSSWTPDKMPQGLLSQKTGGVDYLIKPKRTMNKFSGNAELSYVDADNYSETTTQTYLDGGNTYARRRSQSRNDNFSFSTSHKLELKQQDGVSGLELSPTLNYSHFDKRSSALSATFNANPYDYVKSSALLDSIQQGGSATLRSMMLNRYERGIKTNGHDLSARLDAQYMRMLRNVAYGIVGNIGYKTDHSNTSDIYDLQYPLQTAQSSQHRNMAIRNKPNRTFGYNVGPMLGIVLPHFSNLSISSNVGQKISWQRQARYNCSDEAELPSGLDFLRQVFDTDNSYDFHLVDNFVGGVFRYSHNGEPVSLGENDSYRIVADIQVPIDYHHYRLNYTRGNGDAYSGITRRNATLLSPKATFKYLRNDSIELRLEYAMKQSAPSMTSLLCSFEDTSDPLNIYTGNKDLKNPTIHDLSLLYAFNNYSRQSNFTIKQTYRTTVNALAYAYTLDRTTGIRHYRPQSVDGNYTLTTNIWHWCPLDKRGRLTVKDETLLKLNHGADYISEDQTQSPRRSTVNTWWGTERVELKYKLGKHTLGVKGYVGIGHVSSNRQDFDSYTLCDFNYGLTALLKLPLDMELSTDLTVYSHRGYATSSANTNDLVWNARLSKTFAKAGLTLMVDGFDILGNLSNISQVINSQGRTETYFNSLPRYVMAHVLYRFNKKPKNRQ